MSTPESRAESLRRALRELAEADAGELLAEARERARIRAAKLIEDALVDELTRAAAQLQRSATEPASEPGPTVSADSAATLSADSAATESADSAATESLWWAYCVVPARAAGNLAPQLEGIEPGTAIQTVCEGELAGLVSPVPASEFNDARLRAHLEDLAWLERTARRHEAVLEAVLSETALVPLRLCTLYRDVEGVQRLLRDHVDVLVAGLDRVHGCAEWGVKVFAGDTAGETTTMDTANDDPVASAGSGASYLAQRRRERAQADRASEQRARCAEEVHRRISAIAREARTNAPQSRELHGRDTPMLLNGVYLVANERTQELHDAIRELRSEREPQGFLLELTGPWPAYNFVSGAIGVMP